MTRMEGRNQPDLLNIFHGTRPPAQPVTSPLPPASAPSSAMGISPLSASAPDRTPARAGRRRDYLIIVVLALVILSLAAAAIVHQLNKPAAKPATPPVPGPRTPSAATPVQPGTKPPVAPAKPLPAATPAVSGADAIRVYTPSRDGKGRSFNTLALATYSASKEAQARQTCLMLRAKGRDYTDVFLYRPTAQQILICVGHYDHNPLSDPKATALQAAVRRMPNAAGQREFEECYFKKLTVSEP